MIVKAYKTRVFKENENLIDFIVKYIPKLKNGDIIVVTSKIVSLSEGRTAPICDIKSRIDLIKKESTFAIKTKYTWLTIKDGMFMASSGIDESNADGKIILLPKDSFKSAKLLYVKLSKIYKVKNFGIIISDSAIMPLRNGTVACAIGYFGFNGINNYVGKKDIFGRILKMSRVNIADSLATSAVVSMGEGNEQRPLVLISNVPVVFNKNTNKKDTYIKLKDDIFYPLIKNLYNAKKK
jgi:coenzyme F420-0:L-glutamate ligase